MILINLIPLIHPSFPPSLLASCRRFLRNQRSCTCHTLNPDSGRWQRRWWLFWCLQVLLESEPRSYLEHQHSELPKEGCKRGFQLESGSQGVLLIPLKPRLKGREQRHSDSSNPSTTLKSCKSTWIIIDTMMVRLDDIPAYSDAFGLRPTTFNFKTKCCFLKQIPNNHYCNQGKEDTDIHPRVRCKASQPLCW